jgi:hypothetical protein
MASGVKDLVRCKIPENRFFLRMAVEVVRRVNEQCDQTGLTYARKAMIRCGLSLDIIGGWHEKQLNRDLQIVIKKHRQHFESLAVPDLDPHDDDAPLRD